MKWVYVINKLQQNVEYERRKARIKIEMQKAIFLSSSFVSVFYGSCDMISVIAHPHCFCVCLHLRQKRSIMFSNNIFSSYRLIVGASAKHFQYRLLLVY
jgi:hypothetical protein